MAHAGFEPAISALRGRRPSPLDEWAKRARRWSRLAMIKLPLRTKQIDRAADLPLSAFIDDRQILVHVLGLL